MPKISMIWMPFRSGRMAPSSSCAASRSFGPKRPSQARPLPPPYVHDYHWLASSRAAVSLIIFASCRSLPAFAPSLIEHAAHSGLEFSIESVSWGIEMMGTLPPSLQQRSLLLSCTGAAVRFTVTHQVFGEG